VFDLDDTLYPLRSFVLSGFAAVADYAADELGLPRRAIARALRHASRVDRGHELQRLCGRFDLPASYVARLVEIVRGHTPQIRLPRESARTLAVLRPRWRLGVLTNGLTAIQGRKVAALGLGNLVDAVVFAAECGDGRGKPDAAAFAAILERLGTRASRSVFVGDDLTADVLGAGRVGMRTIHVVRGRPAEHDSDVRPDARVVRLRAVPRLAARLVEGGTHACVA
jgi:putative hydrolase of the HAD superfamily